MNNKLLLRDNKLMKVEKRKVAKGKNTNKDWVLDMQNTELYIQGFFNYYHGFFVHTFKYETSRYNLFS